MCIFESHKQNTGQNYYTKEDNISFENETNFASLETPLTNQNWMHEEITSRINSRNAYYNLNQSLLSFYLLTKSRKIKIHRTTKF